MRADGGKKFSSGQPASVKLSVIKEELSTCLQLAGYMASAEIVKNYLEKRVNVLEREVRLAEIQANAYSSNKEPEKDYPNEDSGIEYWGDDDIGAHDG